jgi:hypothetical protein
MKKLILSLAIALLFSVLSFPQNAIDSLVKYSDLQYHSDFEKLAIHHYVTQASDTFNAFLAIDAKMDDSEALNLYENYKSIYRFLQAEKLDSKNLSKKIKIVYSTVHEYFLKKYSVNDFFPIVFKSGSYNCVTASILYSMVFDNYKIFYKVMASSEHAYLIANPGENSIVIETTNPDFELTIFNGEFKQQYVNYLRNSKLINESEYKNKSTEEIFEEKFNEVKEVKFINLLGFQYYNKALSKFQNNEVKEAYELCQKAYFFYPDLQIKALLNNSLLFEIEKCNFDKITDIDYLAQFARFENINSDVIVGVFNNILNHYLQYNDKQEYVESLFKRLASQIVDKAMLEEISFSYYLRMSRQFFQTNKAEYYISNAIKIKSNHNDANIMLKAFIFDKFSRIFDPKAMLDTLQRLETKYQYEQISPVLQDFKRIAWLKIAESLYNDKKPDQGDKYLVKFENDCTSQVDNQLLARTIESTYRLVAVYYYYKNQKTKAKSYIDKALKYVPNSILIKSAVYQD